MRALSELTTLRLGGRAERLVEARTEEELVDAVREGGDHLLVLAGGSNVVVADEGVPGTVVLVATRGIADCGDGVLQVQAGEPWEPFVARCVASGLAGIECLSGIPGSVGATPIQNVGAYGQDVSQTIRAVRALDRRSREVRVLSPAECEFSYRSSRFKREPGRWVVLAVTFRLARHGDGVSEPVRYPELARALGIGVGDRPPLADVRAAVLALRRGKGMVVDPGDPDSVSVGSFFTNPILSQEAFAALEARVRERLGADVSPPRFPEPDGRIKTSAAWLVERSGIGRGFGLPGPVAVSTKHTLALTNRGGATTAQLVALARQIAAKVHDELGVELVPEPVFVGHAWAALAAPGDVDAEELLRATYAAFNARDIDAVLARMTEDVDWPNAWEGGRVTGRAAVRDYWTRQWAEIDPRVEPLGFRHLPDGRVDAEVHQVARAHDGTLLGEGTVHHVYAFRDGLVSSMHVEPGH